jgi:hypothetical protein
VSFGFTAIYSLVRKYFKNITDIFRDMLKSISNSESAQAEDLVQAFRPQTKNVKYTQILPDI